MGAVGGQRILDNDRLQMRMYPAKIVHQSLCCIAVAVVFVSAVFFQYGFGGQRQNLVVLGVDHRVQGDDGAVKLDSAVGTKQNLSRLLMLSR